MKIKKYTNGAWTDLDKPVKKFGAYTDTATTLPLTIEASATDAIENYQVYGTSEGAGVETENLHNVQTDLLDYRITWATGALIQSQGSSISDYIPVIEGQTYSTNISLLWIGYDSQQTYLGVWYNNANNFVKDGNSSAIDTLTIPNGCQYIRLLHVNSYISNVNFVKDTTVPASYIPFGYKIPISNTSGEQQSNYDLFIGDSKLYEDEYLDFVEQKVYKYVDGVLTPQDPPAPFPAIQAYKGENNLSVDTTVQPEKVSVEYEGWKGVGDVEKYQNGEWSDNNDT